MTEYQKLLTDLKVINGELDDGIQNNECIAILLYHKNEILKKLEVD